MNRIIWQATVMALLAFRLEAQTSLEFFTNEANALLEPALGFGVANIPIYSSTNTNVAYSASLHYLLQSAANAYDATTPATNFPSVFRPLFAWTSNTLYIVGYTNVTTDFYEQTGLGFKALTDPTISSNDNVWGVPWVVGMKNNPPAFYGYCYSSAVFVERQLLFVRFSQANGQPDTNRPPQYTNQFLEMSISNLFGVGSWNFSPSNFPDGVTIVLSNQILLSLTNNYDFGYESTYTNYTNWTVNSWPGWSGNRNSTNSFLSLLLTNITPLPLSYWSESSARFVLLTNGVISNGFLPIDTNQTGWPVHHWVLNITNYLMYALLDNNSGQVLDFVNLGDFGSSIPITDVLTNWTNSEPGGILGLPVGQPWAIGDATDLPHSPMSSGLLYQISAGEQLSSIFSNNLHGLQPGTQGSIFGAPFNPSNVVFQSCSWQSVNPMVHYVLADLTMPETNPIVIVNIPPFPVLTSSLGRLNANYYNSGAIENLSFGLNAGTFQMNFSGANDLPYAIWASSDLLNWSQIGAADQLYPWPYPNPQPFSASFQFNDLAATNFPARYYQVLIP